MQSNNPFTEVGVILISVCLIAGGVLLLVLGKVSFAEAMLMFGLAATIYGGNAALKAPSQAQQAQIGAITQQALNVLPQVVQAAASTPVSVPPQAQPTPPQAPPVYQGAPSVSSLETMPVLPAMPQFSA